MDPQTPVIEVIRALIKQLQTEGASGMEMTVSAENGAKVTIDMGIVKVVSPDGVVYEGDST